MMKTYEVYQYVKEWGDYSPVPTIRTNSWRATGSKIFRLKDLGYECKLIIKEFDNE
jgi:hypothetical protein